ncbi:hypothetical protein [Deinococcus sp.]|uniref:hypothetical protein n=1 Tax=Deinococcus sp. TaxID=47478 RepID=UPI0025B812D6|nr:hypothetical protein [Deinococcus sp.]
MLSRLVVGAALPGGTARLVSLSPAASVRAVVSRTDAALGGWRSSWGSSGWDPERTERRFPWPTLERELRPAEPIERSTCLPRRIP